MINKKELTAPCGLDCFNCEIHESNLTHTFAKMMHEKLDIPIEKVACKGCRQQDGDHFHLPSEGCATLDCVKNKNVDFCCDCDGFPCSMLAPIADGAARYPHNLKLYNLCRISKIGLEDWIEEALQIRKKYFSGEFIVGKGQTSSNI